MASSKVQVPSTPYDHVLRDHNRRIRDRERDCTTSSKSKAATFNQNFKELVRDHFQNCNIVFPSGPRDENSSHSRNGGDGDRDGDESSSSSSSHAMRRRQSRRILDRWAARQAQEMITTIERQTHEAEIVALSSNSQSVSERASTFLRESSPSFSDSSVELPNLRASSLVQMWKEFEAETISPRANQSSPSASVANCNSRMNSNMSSSVGEDPSVGRASGACDERYETVSTHENSFDDWESDQTTQSERLSTSRGQVSDASETSRVADIIRRLTSGSRTQSSLTSWSDENERVQRSSLDQSIVSDQGEQRDLPFIVNTPRLRGRQAFMDLLVKLERERHRELNNLGERHAVSRFPQRRRIQSLLRLRFLQREVSAQAQQRPLRTSSSLSQLRGRTPIIHLRERFSPRPPECARIFNQGDTTPSRIQLPIGTQDLGHPSVSEQFTIDSIAHKEMATFDQNTLAIHQVAPSTSEQNTPTVHDSVTSTSERLQANDCKNVGVVLQGTTSGVGNLDLQERTVDNERHSHGWEGDAIREEIELDASHPIGSLDSWETITEEPDSNTPHVPDTADVSWLSDVSNLQRDWEGSRQEWFQDRTENSSDDENITGLLERRPVSNLLSSGFRARMERLILSYLQRQQTIGETAEEEEEDITIEHMSDADDSDHVASTSLQLPLPARLRSWDEYHDHEAAEDSDHGAYTSLQLTERSPSDYQSSQQCSPFTNRPSLEMELIYDLRGHMARIHHEMSELRKSVQSCMGMQVKLQKAIKQEVAAAVCRSIGGGEAMESNRIPVKKGNCCICYEMPVDSLLYRCGHMCTCFKCAHELQWSSSRCPICRAPILDVVRAYSNA